MFSDVPFPHKVTDGRWNPISLDRAREEIELLQSGHPDAWQRFRNEHECKDAMTFEIAASLGAITCLGIRETFASPLFIGRIEGMFGIDGLRFDELGGGLHAIPPGGYLDVHVDFNRDSAGRCRRINCLLFLNRDWAKTGEPGGELELYADDYLASIIAPEFNREVIFATSDISWHGHPRPRPDRWRYSLAAYYFTTEPPADVSAPHDTIWMPT